MPFWRIFSVLGLAFAMFCLPRIAVALEGVTVVLSEEGGAYAEVVEKMRTTLSQGSTAKLEVRVIPLRSLKNEETLRTNAGQMLVAVGVDAMEAVEKSRLPQPVLNVLVPRAAYEKVARQGGRLGDHRNFSAIYLDQPWARQFALIRQVLPGRMRVGILLGSSSAELETLLRTQAKAAGLVAVIKRTRNDADPLPELKQLLGNCDAVLAVPDPGIYNRNTIQSLLLTTYRHQIPLFGFSPSYVKAGAIAAVYSAPAQIGQQAAEIIQHLAVEPYLPPPQPSRYFSVGVNTQVARSLGLAVDDEATLLKHVMEDAP
ncbi:MAG TPA: ABC transporter substrate binding protein [Sulfuricella sp.]|nr:ABC transporter substrate binding protein [Sulfuricella sp.]